MSEEESVEISLKELINLKKAIYNAMDLIGDISVAGYVHHDKLRKDTQKNLVEAYDILFALNKYLERKTKSTEE